MQQLCIIQTTVDKNLKNNLQFMILTYLWPWKGQGHQTWDELVDPSYNHAHFEKLPSNSVRQKANIEVFVKLENRSILSPEDVQKWKTAVYSLSMWLT